MEIFLGVIGALILGYWIEKEDDYSF